LIDKERISRAVREILIAIGENPDREGLRQTPARIAEMYEEIYAGIEQDPKDAIKTFDESYSDQLVVMKDIPFYSMCEHHLLPFYGVAHIAYIPAPGKLLGLSKLARLVDLCAKKPQLQEKLTAEIAGLLATEAQAIGVAVIIEAEHLCINMRGVRKPGSKTTTSTFRGAIEQDPALREEALRLLGR